MSTGNREEDPVPPMKGFDVDRVSDYTEEQKRKHRERLQERFAEDKRRKARRRAIFVFVLPVTAVIGILAMLLWTGSRILEQRRLAAAMEAGAKDLEVRAIEPVKRKGAEEIDPEEVATARDGFLMSDFDPVDAADEAEIIDARDVFLKKDLAQSEMPEDVAMAWDLIRRGKSAEARGIVEQIKKARPESASGEVLHGAIVLAEDPGEARGCALKALELDAEERRALDLLAASYQIERGRVRSRAAEISLREDELGDYADLLESNPDWPSVLLRSAFQRTALYRLEPGREEDMDEATAELERAISMLAGTEASAELAAAHRYLGKAYRYRADRSKRTQEVVEAARLYNAAVTEFSRALEIDGDDIESIGNIILIRRSAGMHEEAFEEALAALLRMRDGSARGKLLEMLGSLYLQKGDVEAAEKSFEEALVVNLNQPGALLFLARIKLARGDEATAVRILGGAVSRIPEFLEACALLGRIHGERGRPAEAIAAYETALRIPPERAITIDESPTRTEARTRIFFAASNSLALMYLEAGRDPAEARTAAARAEGFRPGDPRILDTLGWIEYAAGDYDAAVDLLRRAVEGGVDQPSVHYHLAASYFKQGRREEALREVAMALGGGAQFRERRDAEALEREIFGLK